MKDSSANYPSLNNYKNFQFVILKQQSKRLHVYKNYDILDLCCTYCVIKKKLNLDLQLKAFVKQSPDLSKGAKRG